MKKLDYYCDCGRNDCLWISMDRNHVWWSWCSNCGWWYLSGEGEGNG